MAALGGERGKKVVLKNISFKGRMTYANDELGSLRKKRSLGGGENTGPHRNGERGKERRPSLRLPPMKKKRAHVLWVTEAMKKS